MADGTVSGMRVALLGLVVAAGIGSYVIWQRSQVPPAADIASGVATSAPEPVAIEVTAPDQIAPEPAATEPDTPAAAAPSAPPLDTTESVAVKSPAAVPPVDQPPTPAAPTFDVVRIEGDGTALVAGTAPADARVSLRLDGVEEVRVQAGRDGAFVAQFTIPPNPAPRLLHMVAILADGTEIAASNTVAVAPIAASVPETATAQPAPPAAIVLSDEGVEVVQGTSPVVVGETVSVILDTIAYAPDGAVQLSGRGQGDADLRIYLDNAPVMDAAVGADGKWAVTLPETVPGIYTLRIDQISAEGNVAARFETPFKRETLQALAAASNAPQPLPPSPPEASSPSPEPFASTEPETVSDPVLPAPSDVANLPDDVAKSVPDASAPELAATTPDLALVEEPAAPALTDDVATANPAAGVVAIPVAGNSVKAAVTVTVQPGFTLWGIATEQFGEGTMYVQVFEANRDSIKDPDLIYPGQVFTLPQE